MHRVYSESFLLENLPISRDNDKVNLRKKASANEEARKIDFFAQKIRSELMLGLLTDFILLRIWKELVNAKSAKTHLLVYLS